MPSARPGGGERHLIRPSGPSGPAVEVFVDAPHADHRRPAILFVHGHQEGERKGGRDRVDTGDLSRLAARGFVAASVSQPGYGGSDGPPDWCGPRTQGAIRAALAWLRRRADVAPARLLLFGTSRGAIASAVVATDEPGLKALVLAAGLYDLASAYPSLPPLIRRAVEAEAGAGAEAFAARSALPRAAAIRADTLILHGRDDERCPVVQAEALAAAMRGAGGIVTLALVDGGHVMSWAEQRRAVAPFIERFAAA